MTRRQAQRARRGAAVAALLVTGLAACGQRGPLVLPSDARPIERLETPPDAADDSTDDERENER